MAGSIPVSDGSIPMLCQRAPKPSSVEMTYVPDRYYSPIGTDGTIARTPLDAIGKHVVGKLSIGAQI